MYLFCEVAERLAYRKCLFLTADAVCRFGVRVTLFVRCRLVDITHFRGEHYRGCVVVEGFIASIVSTI